MDSAKTLKEPGSRHVGGRAVSWFVGTFTVGATVAALLVFTLSPVRGAPARDQDPQDESDSRVQQGLAISPVPLDLHGKNRALVGLGSYLVNAQGDCAACHTDVAPRPPST